MASISPVVGSVYPETVEEIEMAATSAATLNMANRRHQSA